MRPRLVPTDSADLVPDGWESMPAGQWAGRDFVVVYDPRGHDVLLVRARPSARTRAAFVAAGYERVGIGGPQELWARNRVAAARAQVEGHDPWPSAGRSPGREVGGL